MAGGWCVGALVGEANYSTLENCHIKNCVVYSKYSDASAVVGYGENCTFVECSATDNEVISSLATSVFSYIDSEITNCKSERNSLVSTSIIKLVDKSVVYTRYEDANKALITVVDSECSVKNLIGKILSVSVYGEKLEKNSDGVYKFKLKDTQDTEIIIEFEDFDDIDFGYTLDFKTLEIMLCSYYGEETNVVFPDTFGGLPVTAISHDFAFYTDKPVKNLTFMGGLKVIDTPAFNFLSDIETVTFEEGIEKIGDYTFGGCESLKEVNFPDSLKEIGEASFNYCGNLEKASLPPNLERVKDNAFIGCRKLRPSQIPDSLKYIGASAFQNCGSSCVVFSENIKTIGATSFGYTTFTGVNYRLVRIPNFKVYGYSGTYAEHYANMNGFEFIDIADSKPEIVDEGFDYAIFQKGDADLDSEITIFDVTTIQMYLAKKKKFNGVQEWNSIIGNYNGEINITCATEIQRYLAKIIEDFDEGAMG